MRRDPRVASTVTLVQMAALAAVLLAPALSLAAPRGRPARPAAPPRAPLQFNRDVLPILADNCFACHGFDAQARKAGLRLDTREGALQRLPSGLTAVVPGKPDSSSLVRRIANHSMPPRNSGKQLTAAQIATLTRWVAEGARYETHWAYLPPVRPQLPAVRDLRWPLNAIDRFVLARLEREGLRPSPVADRRTLIRRLSFDLTGLPPSRAEVEAFLNDRAPGAYERLVDRLLASPHYGERMALKWLDLARYADTHGYHIDSHRDMWPWRDWVIRAFNENKPFDQFTIEQLAGDLLPNATREQKIATGFNRNHPINFEGGAIAEEYHAAYIFDRVDTTATTWMAMTMRCAQCHDHKYDPFSQKDFYRLYAFFHNINEQGLDGNTGNARPYIPVPSPEQEARLAALETRLGELQRSLEQHRAATVATRAEWEPAVEEELRAGRVLGEGLAAHFAMEERDGTTLAEADGRLPSAALEGRPAWEPGRSGTALRLDGKTVARLGGTLGFERHEAFSFGAWLKPDGTGPMTVLSRMDDSQGHRGWDLYLSGNRAYVHLIHQWEGNAIRVNTRDTIDFAAWRHVFVTYDGSGKAAGVRIYLDGEPAPLEVTHDTLTDTIRTEAPALIGRRQAAAPYSGLLDELRVYRRALAPGEVKLLAGLEALRAAAAVPAAERTAEQQQALLTYQLEQRDARYRSLRSEETETRRERDELNRAIPTTMVMEELPEPRETHVLLRGEYDQKGERVTAGTPGSLPPLPEGYPANRLGFARWLVDPRHPLTARVAVNRFWQQYFGQGLVRTAENFGTQGEPPSHPELLDWLATEFVRTGWDIKAMQRLIVTSATYRQVSRVTPALLERDPENRLLARGPRVRLAAEFIRDQALAVSGLLNRQLGGPSVKPYQPPGLWEELAFGGNFTAQTYVQDTGDKLYRRSMYIFWKRTCPPPALQTFDAPEREVCVVRRSTSNTPLQSLVLMNDTTYVEAARKFAERILLEGGATDDARLTWAAEEVLARAPTPPERAELRRLLQRQLARYRADAAAAERLLQVGESPRNPSLNTAELAAWSNLASVLLNLDEAITRQ
jgi:mono/diheme cytochrome c family protein